jgi:hypothetical protein
VIDVIGHVVAENGPPRQFNNERTTPHEACPHCATKSTSVNAHRDAHRDVTVREHRCEANGSSG